MTVNHDWNAVSLCTVRSQYSQDSIPVYSVPTENKAEPDDQELGQSKLR